MQLTGISLTRKDTEYKGRGYNKCSPFCLKGLQFKLKTNEANETKQNAQQIDAVITKWIPLENGRNVAINYKIERTMNKAYHKTLQDWFFEALILIKLNHSTHVIFLPSVRSLNWISCTICRTEKTQIWRRNWKMQTWVVLKPFRKIPVAIYNWMISKMWSLYLPMKHGNASLRIERLGTKRISN